MVKELEIINVIRETQESSSITFRVPDAIKKDFKYYPGQYLTFVLNIGGEMIKRSYSISSCPFTEKDITVAVKRVQNGVMSNYINDNLKVGDKVSIEGPAGNFRLDAGGFFKFGSYVFFAGGSGITPVISMIKAVLAKERFSKVTLYYANRDARSVIYDARLKELIARYEKKINVQYILENPEPSWKGLSGILNKDKCMELVRNSGLSVSGSSYYICGPKPMMDVVVESLTALGVGKKKINLEYFSAPGSDTSAFNPLDITDTTLKKITAVVDGKEKGFELRPQQNILEGAIAADLDVAYSCREGVCSSCKGQLLAGEVKMKESHGLTEKEKAQGYILTCQSYVVTPAAKVKFCN
jgi:ring-1,2-phenylacetyl-CoA epoxidase subunit PaaE